MSDEELDRARGPSPRRAPAPAAASSPRTRWRWPSRCSASRRWAARWCPPRTARRARWPRTAAGWSMDAARAATCGPSAIITKDVARERDRRASAMTGGSTNAVLHLLAVANEAGVELTIDDFDRIAWSTPLLADLKPGGRFVATDLYRAGGVPLVAKRLRGGRLAPARTRSPSPAGRSARRPTSAEEAEGQEVIRPLDDPLKPNGGFAILRGNLAPDGCVVKLSGHGRREHTRPGARVRVRGGGLRRGQGAGDQGGRRRGDPQRGPRRRPGHARDARRHRGARGARASATPSRCSPTAASPAPPTASWPATSRPRRRAAARSPRCATATRSPSTSTHRELDVELSDEEIAERVAAYEPPAAASTRPACSASTPATSARRPRAR